MDPHHHHHHRPSTGETLHLHFTSDAPSSGISTPAELGVVLRHLEYFMS